MSDSDLLKSYAQGGAADAFATLVNRHVDLVYSVARRHVRSASIAEEVAQSVFVELARHARKIKPGTPLIAWLHIVSRRTAINVMRDAARRQAREKIAAEIAAMKSPSSEWSGVEPLLDEAVESLPEPDRAAILLRFFENKPLREVGLALGTSDDAAQKRVTRAIDQLRAFFLRRGVTVTATGLATDLSAHALQTAPMGLTATISSAAAAVGPAISAATLGSTNAIAMTTIQKSIATALVLAVGTSVYEATAFARQSSEIAAQERQAAALTGQLRRTTEQQTVATARLKATESLIDSRIASVTTDATLESRLRGWQGNLNQLRQTLQQRPNLSIPELQLLSDDDWFNAAAKAKLDSDDELRGALAGLRTQATQLMGVKLRKALNAYLKANDGTLPNHINQLLPFFDPPIEPTWLERYEMLRTGKLSALVRQEQARIIGPKSFGDVEYDPSFTFGPNGGSSGPVAMDDNVHLAIFAFANAHGRRNKTAAELMPYLKWPASEAAVQKILDAQNARTGEGNPRPASNLPSGP